MTDIKAHVVVVEDDPDIQQLLHDYLCHAGFKVTAFSNGQEALDELRSLVVDLVILDIMLPGLDGLEVCQALRQHSQVPIIFLTARHEEIDRLLGLRLGGDDFICKPFSPREVIARCEAILRRQNWGHKAPLLANQGLELDESAYSARLDGTVLDLTPVEFRLLAILSNQPGRVFRRDQLVDEAYDDYRVVSDRTIDSHIKNLRIKLTAANPAQNYIHSVYGVGYRFEPSAP